MGCFAEKRTLAGYVNGKTEVKGKGMKDKDTRKGTGIMKTAKVCYVHNEIRE